MKELEDQCWFPAVLRNAQTDYIGFVVERFGVYRPFIQYLHTLDLPAVPMQDLCSGSGQPAVGIYRKCDVFSRLTLSDKFPQDRKFASADISYLPHSVDVLNMAFLPGNCYTMFNAFHHFSDADKLKIMENIRNAGSSAFFVEILEPDLLCLCKVLFATTIGCLLLMPFVRPFSFWRLFFTYILPINIFTITYDGILSVFAARSRKKYAELFAGSGEDIQVKKIKGRWNNLIIIQCKVT